MRVQRTYIPSILGMLMVSTIGVSVFAQTPPVTTLPVLPVIAPDATGAMPGLPTMPGGQVQPPANMAAPLPPQTPTAPVIPMGAPLTPGAAAAAVSNTPAATLPSLPSAAPQPSSSPQPSLGAVLHDMAHGGEIAPQIPEVNKTYSFGSSSLSILFMPAQIDHMKQAIRTYENSGHSATTFVAPTPVVNAPAAVAVNEPATYPVFYLASILYDSPGKWSVWVSGHKITSSKNGTDLSVVSIGRESVTFAWSPNYIAAINQRHLQKQFAPVAPVKNRLLRSQPINLNATNAAVTFTLKPNQSFSVGYFSMFEGFMPAPKMPAVTAPVAGATVDLSARPSTMGAAPVPPGQSRTDGMPGSSNPTMMPSAMDPMSPQFQPAPTLPPTH